MEKSLRLAQIREVLEIPPAEGEIRTLRAGMSALPNKEFRHRFLTLIRGASHPVLGRRSPGRRGIICLAHQAAESGEG